MLLQAVPENLVSGFKVVFADVPEKMKRVWLFFDNAQTIKYQHHINFQGSGRRLPQQRYAQ
jgi:hypothetical protein